MDAAPSRLLSAPRTGGLLRRCFQPPADTRFYAGVDLHARVLGAARLWPCWPRVASAVANRLRVSRGCVLGNSSTVVARRTRRQEERLSSGTGSFFLLTSRSFWVFGLGNFGFPRLRAGACRLTLALCHDALVLL